MRVAVSLSDPWELGEAIGWRTLVGSVTHRGTNSWLIELGEPFTYAGSEYRLLVVSARYVGSSLAQSASEAVDCNIIRTTPDRASGPDPCDLSWWRGGGAMIGSIESTH